MRTVSAQGNNLRNILAEARRVLGVRLADSRVKLDASDDAFPQLHRVELMNGDVVEASIIQHARCEASIIATE